MKRILHCHLPKIYDIHFPCHVPGSANYHVDTVNRRYFGPISPPVFVNPGGTKIKVKVGDTVTIPCKIHNKGMLNFFFENWQKNFQGRPNFWDDSISLINNESETML